MKARRMLLVVASLLLLVPWLAQPRPVVAAPAMVGPVLPPSLMVSPYVVVFKDAVFDPFATTQSLTASYGLTASHTYDTIFKGFAVQLPAFLVPVFLRLPQVDYIIPDTISAVDGFVPLSAGESMPPGVARIGAGTATTAETASTVSVAVIDSGIDLKHPDLNVVDGVNCVTPGTPAQDDFGHGTHVAGIIGATNTGSGVVGVAPGTRLIAVKTIDKNGIAQLSNTLCGLNWVAAKAFTMNIKVANLSFGGEGTSDTNCGKDNNDPKHTAICILYAFGVVPVVSAGNRSGDIANQTPAAYAQALTVTAMTDTDGAPGGVGPAPRCSTRDGDDRAFYQSNYAVSASDKQHTVAAPGVCVTSTWLNGSYKSLSGTSMAAPIVAGTVALCFGSGGKKGPCNGLAPAQVIRKIVDDSTKHMTNTNGFEGDPRHPVPGQTYGPLVWAGGY